MEISSVVENHCVLLCVLRSFDLKEICYIKLTSERSHRSNKTQVKILEKTDILYWIFALLVFVPTYTTLGIWHYFVAINFDFLLCFSFIRSLFQFGGKICSCHSLSLCGSISCSLFRCCSVVIFCCFAWMTLSSLWPSRIRQKNNTFLDCFLCLLLLYFLILLSLYFFNDFFFIVYCASSNKISMRHPSNHYFDGNLSEKPLSIIRLTDVCSWQISLFFFATCLFFCYLLILFISFSTSVCSLSSYTDLLLFLFTVYYWALVVRFFVSHYFRFRPYFDRIAFISCFDISRFRIFSPIFLELLTIHGKQSILYGISKYTAQPAVDWARYNRLRRINVFQTIIADATLN